MFSSNVSVGQWEVWIFAPGGVREVFGSCCVYESRGQAERVAAAIADWLHLGAWFDAALDVLTPDDRTDLFALREGYKADGVSLGLVRVGAKPVSAMYDRDEPPADDDDGDGEDTSLELDAPPHYTVGEGDYELI